MAEPTGSLLPDEYDNSQSLLGTLVDHRNLQLAVEIDDDDTDIQVVGTVPDILLPVYITFETGEIIFCETVREGNNGWVDVLRGRRGTTAAEHEAGEAMWPAVSGKHVSLLRDALIAAQRCQGLYIDMEDFGDAVAGAVNVASDTHKVWFANTAWIWVGRTDHDELDGLEDDDHEQYHTDARALTWHDELTGGHVIDGDDHDHTQGNGVGRVLGGLLEDRPAPSAEREVYYATDTQVLYISPDGINWAPVTGAPAGVICWFTEAALDEHDHACPVGWTRYTDLDERFPIGAPVEEAGDATGADAHVHAYAEIPAHIHSCTGGEVTSSTTGSHNHTYSFGVTGSGSKIRQFQTDQSSNFFSTEDAGAHDHDVFMPERDSNDAQKTAGGAFGVEEGETSEEDNLPPYITVVFCQKD